MALQFYILSNCFSHRHGGIANSSSPRIWLKSMVAMACWICITVLSREGPVPDLKKIGRYPIYYEYIYIIYDYNWIYIYIIYYSILSNCRLYLKCMFIGIVSIILCRESWMSSMKFIIRVNWNEYIIRHQSAKSETPGGLSLDETASNNPISPLTVVEAAHRHSWRCVVVMRPWRSLLNGWDGTGEFWRSIASSKCGRHRWPCNFGCIHDPWIHGQATSSDHFSGQGMTVCTGPPQAPQFAKRLRACWGQADRVS